MFKPLFGKRKLVFDPSLGDHLGKAILNEAKKGRLDTLLKQIDLLRAGEWDRRAFYVDLAAHYLTDGRDVDRLADTATGNLIKGNLAMHIAWKARGGGDASTVTPEGWTLFRKNLNLAGKHLVRAAEQDPADPTPLALLQTVATGLPVDKKIAGAWFDEALRRDPTNQQAHYRRLTMLCQKWGGSHEAMYAFARASLKRIPANSTLQALLFFAFQEHFLYLRAFDNNEAGAKALVRDEAVREESITVYQNSLQKRERIERVSDYWPHNVAAWWFFTLNLPHPVREETKKIGPYFTEFPWRVFYRDPAAGYQRALDF